MVTYKYSAVSRGGKKVKGMVEAFNRFDAVERIKADCDVVLKLTEVKEKKGILSTEVGGKSFNKKAFTVMCSQFSIILKAGVPIARTCRLIAEKTTDKKLKKMLKGVTEDVEAGRSVASAFEDRGGAFLPVTFIETIRAGEETGSIDRSFESMYQHYDKQTQMAAKVKSALSYPVFVIAVAIAVVIVIMVKVVPTFMDIFASYGSDLPLITRILIGISNFFIHWWMVIVAVCIAICLFYKIYNSTEQGRVNLAKLQLKLPVLGNIASLNCASEFANVMTTLLASGLPLTRSINITSKVLSNYYISTEVGKVIGSLEEGHSLGESMRRISCMPDILIDMVAVGEETGELEETLNTISKFYDAELEMAINMALKKLEPTLLLFIAAVAGFIVLAVYIAMFDMYALF